jgi:outer membrane biosynthesis protein TonB
MPYEQSWTKLETASDRKSKIITAIITVLILLLLFLTAFKAPEPDDSISGILIDFGNTDYGSGEVEPYTQETPVTPVTPVEEISQVEEIETQDFQETIEIETTDDPVIKPREVNTEVTMTPQELEEELEQEVDQSLTFNSNQNQNFSNSPSEGVTEGDGNQGVETGDPDADNHWGDVSTGIGDEGLSFGLDGRAMTGLPKGWDHQIDGYIRILIEVDQSGNVVSAKVDRKNSSVVDPVQIQQAVKAAKDARFNRKSDAPISQQGWIKFNLKRK